MNTWGDEGIRAARHCIRAGVAAGLMGVLLSGAALAAPTVLAPLYDGATLTGDGAQAEFFQIDSRWRGSTVLWNEAAHAYGSGVAIGTTCWGTGLWGRADWQTVQSAAHGQPAAFASPAQCFGGTDTGSYLLGTPSIINSWSGLAPTISFANELFNDTYSAQFGTAGLVPLLAGQDGPQENWTSRFAGVIRVTEAGFYNFSVLNDDGFFLRLIGAGGEEHSFERDYLNDPARSVLGDGFLLSAGLYGFELGEWNREQVGVVDLRWMHAGTDGWELVPTGHVVPEPGSLALAMGGVLALVGVRRRGAGQRPR